MRISSTKPNGAARARFATLLVGIAATLGLVASLGTPGAEVGCGGAHETPEPTESSGHALVVDAGAGDGAADGGALTSARVPASRYRIRLAAAHTCAAMGEEELGRSTEPLRCRWNHTDDEWARLAWNFDSAHIGVAAFSMIRQNAPGFARFRAANPNYPLFAKNYGLRLVYRPWSDGHAVPFTQAYAYSAYGDIPHGLRTERSPAEWAIAVRPEELWVTEDSLVTGAASGYRQWANRYPVKVERLSEVAVQVSGGAVTPSYMPALCFNRMAPKAYALSRESGAVAHAHSLGDAAVPDEGLGSKGMHDQLERLAHLPSDGVDAGYLYSGFWLAALEHQHDAGSPFFHHLVWPSSSWPMNLAAGDERAWSRMAVSKRYVAHARDGGTATLDRGEVLGIFATECAPLADGAPAPPSWDTSPPCPDGSKRVARSFADVAWPSARARANAEADRELSVQSVSCFSLDPAKPKAAEVFAASIREATEALGAQGFVGDNMGSDLRKLEPSANGTVDGALTYATPWRAPDGKKRYVLAANEEQKSIQSLPDYDVAALGVEAANRRFHEAMPGYVRAIHGELATSGRRFLPNYNQFIEHLRVWGADKSYTQYRAEMDRLMSGGLWIEKWNRNFRAELLSNPRDYQRSIVAQLAGLRYASTAGAPAILTAQFINHDTHPTAYAAAGTGSQWPPRDPSGFPAYAAGASLETSLVKYMLAIGDTPSIQLHPLRDDGGVGQNHYSIEGLLQDFVSRDTWAKRLLNLDIGKDKALFLGADAGPYVFFSGTVSQPGEVALLARRFDRALVLYNIGTQPATYRLPGDVAYGHVRMVPFQGTLSPMETRMRPAPLCLASEGLDVEAVDACLLRGERCDVTCRPPTVAETASDGGTSGAWRSESRFAPLLALEGYARGTDIQLEPAEVVLLITPAALDRTGAYYVDRMNMTGHALAKRTPAPERAIVAGRSPSAKLGDAVLP